MEWLTALLVWLSGDAEQIDRERPRAAAAVTLAYCTMAKQGAQDAAEDTESSAALGEPGAGLAAEAGRQQPTDSSGTRLLRQATPGVAAGCPDGKCVAVPRVRTR